jgi:hypothetical protein
MTRLGKGALVAGVAGVALFLSMFVSWFGAAESGWSSMGWFGVGAIALAIVCGVSFAAVLYTRASISVPPALATLACGIGVLAFLVVLYRLIDPPGAGEVSREIGVWLGVAASAAIALGGWLGMQEEKPRLETRGDAIRHP